ncbi:serum paraoxonase arylesterase [Fusarium subglutinans]|uniref:Serum paraoxonase arylesterase n=1 Tax=Gibberella subglutinans TaxID=42677 RepID=A0A8H5PRL2_GIBSU|nr:serum paraoxonase arylesterase [Fusarium subglutinans]KAF5601707.1 serum paraoxonase arylesterase [Fusarium subglutinans]
MASLFIKTSIATIAILAIFFQIYLKEAIWLGFGINRTIQPLSEFPYQCRKIVHHRLEACEDIFGYRNISGRSERDAIVALDIDKPTDNGLEFRTLITPSFEGTAGDGLVNLAGFSGVEQENGDIDLFLVNLRPAIDADGKLADQYVHGGNSTIEHFVTGPQATEMKHVRTYAQHGITTPNRVAALGDGSFYISNDHGPHKFGWVIIFTPILWLVLTNQRHHLSMILGFSDVTFCDTQTCKTVAPNLQFPNGLVIKDNILYLPDSITGRLYIYRILPNRDLEKIDEVNLGYGVDNASIDENGDIWIAAFPIGVEIFKAYDDPYNAHPPSTVLRVRKVEGEYVVEKVLEDAKGEVLPAATTVVHDTKTGRLFLSSVISPFIAVCKPKL